MPRPRERRPKATEVSRLNGEGAAASEGTDANRLAAFIIGSCIEGSDAIRLVSIGSIEGSEAARFATIGASCIAPSRTTTARGNGRRLVHLTDSQVHQSLSSSVTSEALCTAMPIFSSSWTGTARPSATGTDCRTTTPPDDFLHTSHASNA